MTEHVHCSRCKGKLHSKYYQDVPGQGDLCLACHHEWIEESKSSPKTKTRADFIREVKPGEHIDFDVKSTTHYASIRGSAYSILGKGAVKFERLRKKKVRMYRL